MGGVRGKGERITGIMSKLRSASVIQPNAREGRVSLWGEGPPEGSGDTHWVG